MSTLQIILLALIQGAAELLPVSSSAHVIVAERCMGLDPSAPQLTFLLVMLHTGTMFAVLCYFWPRWKSLLWPAPDGGAPTGRFSGWHFIKAVILATVCTGVVGLGLKVLIEKVIFERLPGQSKAKVEHLIRNDAQSMKTVGDLDRPKGEVEDLFRNLPLMAASLFAVGLLIIAAGFHETKAEVPTVSARSSLWIGLVQGLCLPFRGFSRSGATISTALFRGISRPRAEDFSFALAVVLTPPVVVWELRRLVRSEAWQGSTEIVPLLLPGLLGMACSFVAGLVALRLLSAVLERGAWRYFGYYCLAASLVVLGVWWLIP